MTRAGILFCGNGYSGEVLQSLADDYDVYMISSIRNDRGMEYVKKLMLADPLNPISSLKAAKKLMESGHHFSAVLSLCMDSALSVAIIAEHFKLFGVSYETACNATNKSIRSELFEAHHVSAPRYRHCDNYEELLIKYKEIGFPFVIKPLNLFSSRGVVLVEREEDVRKAYEYCVSMANAQQVIINEYVIGTEYSTEGLMINSQFYLSGLSERVFHYKRYKPLFIEIGDIMPTLLSENEILACAQLTEKAALALGITNGIVKGDLIKKPEGDFKVFEITPRLGGPRFGTEMIPLSNGTNILKAAIQQALGEKIDLELLNPRFNSGMVNRTIFVPSGRITRISGLDEIVRLPGYYDFKWWKVKTLKLGDIVLKPESMSSGVGYIIVTGADRAEAIANADRIEKRIVIETEPLTAI